MTEKNKTLKFFGYCRASTDEQRTTLLHQEDLIKNYCKYKNYEIINIYIEGGCSGSIDAKNRPEMSQILNRLQKGEGDGLICTKIDRLSRNSADFINILNYFNKNDIQLIILEPEIDTKSIFGKLMCTIMSALAEMELNMIRQRTKDALQKMKSNNECVGSIPYGYSKLEDNKLIENEDEQKLIIRICDLYNSGISCNKIAQKFNNENIPKKDGCIWFPIQIKRVLEQKNIYKNQTKKRAKF